MNHDTITFRTFLEALKHQKKTFILCLLLFVVLGTAAGFLFSDQGAGPANGSADELLLLDNSDVARNQNFFSQYYAALSKNWTNASTYLKTISAQPELSNESKKELAALTQQLNEYKEAVLNPINSKLSSYEVYVLPDFIDELIEYYQREIAFYEGYLIQAEKAAETLANMEAPRVSNETSDEAYGQLLAQASQIGTYSRRLHENNVKLDSLLTSPSTVRQNSAQMETALKEGEMELNILISKINALVPNIALKHSLIFTASYDANNALSVSVSHTHTEASRSESFVIIVLFTTLVGACSGVFFAVAKEARRQRHMAAATVVVSSAEETVGETAES